MTVDEAIERAADLLAGTSERVILGITGPPGSGKSTLTARLVASVPGAVAVGMDGFHLAHSVLSARGDTDLKGALHTFDGPGYVALLRRIRGGEPGTIWAPEFRREIEDAIGSAVPIAPDTRLVVTEGNYLLVDEEPWRAVRELCDEIWYVDVDDDTRLRRLTDRHVQFGRSPEAAWARSTTGSDGINAGVVAATREAASALVRLD